MMNYELRTYACSKGDYYVVYVVTCKQRLSLYITFNKNDAYRFIREDGAGLQVVETAYNKNIPFKPYTTCGGCE